MISPILPCHLYNVYCSWYIQQSTLLSHPTTLTLLPAGWRHLLQHRLQRRYFVHRLDICAAQGLVQLFVQQGLYATSWISSLLITSSSKPCNFNSSNCSYLKNLIYRLNCIPNHASFQQEQTATQNTKYLLSLSFAFHTTASDSSSIKDKVKSSCFSK